MSTRIAFVGVLAALLLGCGSGQVMVYDVTGQRYSTTEYFDYAARKGAIHTEVVGLPFQVNPQQLQQRVLSLMSGHNLGPSTDFVAENTARTNPAYKVVVAFNPAPTVSADTLCRTGARQALRGPGDPVTTRMAFCMGDYALSGASGRVGHVTGLQDPVFAELVQQTLLSLYPIEREYNNRD